MLFIFDFSLLIHSINILVLITIIPFYFLCHHASVISLLSSCLYFLGRMMPAFFYAFINVREITPAVYATIIDTPYLFDQLITY